MTDQVTTTRAGSRSSGIRRGEAAAGWIFTAPVIIILGVFLLVPVLMALWVSFSDWSGRGIPPATDARRGYAHHGPGLGWSLTKESGDPL